MRAFVQGATVYAGDDDRTAREFLCAIGDFIDSDARMKKKPEERHAFAMSRYSWDQATNQYLEIARRLVPPTVFQALAVKTRNEKGCR
jgi:hypothetical protein